MPFPNPMLASAGISFVHEPKTPPVFRCIFPPSQEGQAFREPPYSPSTGNAAHQCLPRDASRLAPHSSTHHSSTRTSGRRSSRSSSSLPSFESTVCVPLELVSTSLPAGDLAVTDAPTEAGLVPFKVALADFAAVGSGLTILRSRGLQR